MFTAALYTIDCQDMEATECPLTDEWIKPCLLAQSLLPHHVSSEQFIIYLCDKLISVCLPSAPDHKLHQFGSPLYLKHQLCSGATWKAFRKYSIY